MTVETKTTIQPGDLVAVNIECSACGTVSARKITDYRNDPYGCANCGASWSTLADDFRNLGLLLRYISFFAGRQDSTAIPFKLRFEIAAPKVQP